MCWKGAACRTSASIVAAWQLAAHTKVPLLQVMSQQTQLPRVVEYFRRWTARWPTVQALAAATQDEVCIAYPDIIPCFVTCRRW
jgi:hypothetical protein